MMMTTMIKSIIPSTVTLVGIVIDDNWKHCEKADEPDNNCSDDEH